MNAFDQAVRIADEMYFNPDPEKRMILITPKNKGLIVELTILSAELPWFNCHVMSIVGSKKKWFCIHSHKEGATGGIVVRVDFKAGGRRVG